MKPDPNIAFILAFFFPGVGRMYIGQPVQGVVKLILVALFPIWIFFGAALGTLVSEWVDLDDGGWGTLLGFVAGFAGPIWWFGDLFVIRKMACWMHQTPYCKHANPPTQPMPTSSDSPKEEESLGSEPE